MPSSAEIASRASIRSPPGSGNFGFCRLTADTIEGYVSAVRPFLDGRLREGDELDVAGLERGRCRGVRRRPVSGAVARAGEDGPYADVGITANKERNVLDHLPERDRPAGKRRLRAVWKLTDHRAATDRLEALAD